MPVPSPTESSLEAVLSCPELASIASALPLPQHLNQVAEPAWAFLTAAFARYWQSHHSSPCLWVTCSHPRLRERLTAEMSLWQQTAYSLPLTSDATDEEGLPVDPESAAERLAIIEKISSPEERPLIVILDADSLNDLVPSQTALGSAAMALELGQELEMNELVHLLSEAGFERQPHVFGRGQYAVRGGIIDVFSWQAELPLRIEFFDTEIDSLREFDVDSQVSQRKITKARLLLTEPQGEQPLGDLIAEQDLHIHLGGDLPPGAHLHIEEDLHEVASDEKSSLLFTPSPFGTFEAGDFVLQESRRDSVFQQLADWADNGWHVHLTFANKGESDRFTELAPDKLLKRPEIHSVRGELMQGFIFREGKTAWLSTAELFGRYQQPGTRRQRAQTAPQRRAQTAVEEINEGDLVVHAEYGIGRFQGIEKDEDGEEEITIEYRDGALLSVPIDQSHLMARYVGIGGKAPKLNKLGDAAWNKTRAAANKSVQDYAAQLLRLQAERQSGNGYAHAPDNQWMFEFEHSFHFTETPDQRRAIDDTKRDMESTRSMDRLVCGDVGFGKTEVAIRAAFKAATGGKQVAILAPTTVLAEQHWRTFRQRMSDYPLKIELLNRFRTAAETRKTLEGLANGSVDIIIGTHRLISKDVEYKNLGLAIIDEEQRFGVKHKERFKEMFRNIDMLTLSATPIPRTLYLSLMGARDMSTIDTAPPNRVPVRTSIQPYHQKTIKEAIERELKRGGQVFFLHNRVKTIEAEAKKLQALVPHAKIVIGHGQMEKDELEDVMHEFIEGNADILLATTIIESGIDIPNANTIIIDRADRFGLADLYQLRGRVGRAGQQAYAILLLPNDMTTQGDARKRINAIRDYTALGSGFKIAMRDLEIRGAGNLLGTKQSGHIAAIGFDLYCQLLRQSVDILSGKRITARVDVTLRADFLSFSEADYQRSSKNDTLPAFIPSSYMSEARLRITAYKQLAQLASLKELRALAETWTDRFGKLPKEVDHLLLATELKILAADALISSIEISAQRLMLKRNGNFIQIDGGRFPRLQHTKPLRKLKEARDLLAQI